MCYRPSTSSQQNLNSMLEFYNQILKEHKCLLLLRTPSNKFYRHLHLDCLSFLNTKYKMKCLNCKLLISSKSDSQSKYQLYNNYFAACTSLFALSGTITYNKITSICKCLIFICTSFTRQLVVRIYNTIYYVLNARTSILTLVV